MSSIPPSIFPKPGMVLVLFMLVGWVLPAQAGTRGGDWVQLAEWVGNQLLRADNREYSDSSSSYVRRYPPRQSRGYERSDYPDQRGNRNSNRDYEGRNSSPRYDDRETVTEQRRYYDGKRAPYPSASRGNRRSSDNREAASGERQYSGGRRGPYSSGSQGNGRYPGKPKSASRQRQKQNGKRAPYSSESRGGGRSSDSRAPVRRDTSLDDAVSRVRRQSEGRVLSAETVRKDSREEHRVRIITDDGRVRRYRMDAQTGNLLPRKR